MATTTETPIASGAAAPAAAAPAPAPAPATKAGGAAGGAPGAHKSASLYVGDLSPEVNENILFETFQAVAPVTGVKVCRHSLTNVSLGYAYVNFGNAADAERAMEELNYTDIRGRSCRIMWSQRDPTVRRSNVGNIFVKNLSNDVTTKELSEVFRLLGRQELPNGEVTLKPGYHVLSCKVATDEKGLSKGYGFVHMESEEAAREAVERLDNLPIGDRKIRVMPYVARPQRSGPEWTNVFLKSIPKEWTLEELKSQCGAFGEVLSAVLMEDAAGLSKGFGFVNFRDHASALKAVEELNGKEVDGTPASIPPGKKASDMEGVKTVKLYVGRAMRKQERERALREKQQAAKREREQKWSTCNLYVRNLDETVDDEALRREFSGFGDIISARVERDPEGRSKLFGYVLFANPEDASKAMNETRDNKKLVKGKPLYVAFWQPKEVRQQQALAYRNQQSRAGANAAAAGAAGGAGAAGAPGLAGAAGLAGLGGAGAAALNPQMMQQFMAFLAMLTNPGMALQNPQISQMLLSNALRSNPAMQMMLRGQGMPGALQGAGAPGQMPGAGGRTAAGPAGPGMAGFVTNPAAAAAAGNAQAAAAAVLAQQAQRFGAAPTQQQQAQAMQQQQAQQRQGGGAGGRQGGMPQQGGAAPQQRQQQQGAGVQQQQQRPGALPAGAAAGRPAAAAPPAVPGATGAGVLPSMPQQQRLSTGIVPGVVYSMAASGGHMAASQASDPLDTSALVKMAPGEAKKVLGEKLFPLIAKLDPSRPAKITGMLLHAVEVTDLIHLLEAPDELAEQVKEAQSVLDSASESH